MLSKTTYTTLFVSDQDRPLEFYTKVLGMTNLVDSRQPGGRRFVTVGIHGHDLQIILRSLKLPYVTAATVVDPDGNRPSIRERPKPSTASGGH